jgi:hypothetical protein
MKYNVLISFVIISVIASLVGYIMRVMHWPYGIMVFYFGLIFFFTSAILIGLKVARKG